MALALHVELSHLLYSSSYRIFSLRVYKFMSTCPFCLHAGASWEGLCVGGPWPAAE